MKDYHQLDLTSTITYIRCEMSLPGMKYLHQSLLQSLLKVILIQFSADLELLPILSSMSICQLHLTISS